MGCPSPPLAIKLVGGQPTGLLFPKQPSTISLSHAVQWGDRCQVFRGRLGGRAVVAKISSDCADRTESPLKEEYAVYQILRDLQGSAVPRCYGLFRVGDSADMLLLEDCGESLDSYDGLTPNQRCVQCLPYLHPTDRSQGVSFLPRLCDSPSPRLSPGLAGSGPLLCMAGTSLGCTQNIHKFIYNWAYRLIQLLL